MFDLKYSKARRMIRDAGSGVVAFSGGVDSSALSALAFEVLGDGVLAVTLDSQTLPRRELALAKKIAAEIGVHHLVVSHSELESVEFSRNPRNRCYYCKRMLAVKLKSVALERGFDVVFEGTNADELSGHRPGWQAISEEGLLSPFALAGLGKDDVRGIARSFGLSCWDKPQNACLSSRVPYGVEITEGMLLMVERAEDVLKDLGVGQVRVRYFGDTASIEVEAVDFDIVRGRMGEIEDAFKKIGFAKTVLDDSGYRTGSLSEAQSSSGS